MMRAWPSNSHRTAVALMGLGAGIGLLVMAPFSLYLPALVGTTAFGIVLLIALLVIRRPTARRASATAAAWFALVGGYAVFWTFPFLIGPSGFYFGLTVGVLGVFGMCVSLIGAGLARLPETDYETGRLVDRNRLAAMLVCAGGSLGFIGAPLAFFGIFALVKLFGFSLVLIFGVLLFQRRQESRLLAGAVIYFAIVAGSLDLVFLNYPIWLAYLFGLPWLAGLTFVGPIGMTIAIAGAAIRLVRIPTQNERQSTSPPGFARRGA